MHLSTSDAPLFKYSNNPPKKNSTSRSISGGNGLSCMGAVEQTAANKTGLGKEEPLLPSHWGSKDKSGSGGGSPTPLFLLQT